MTSHLPPPDRRGSGPQWSEPQVPGPRANPSWLGHVQEQNYRQAPANDAGPPRPVVPAAVVGSRSRASPGAAGLVVAGGMLGFLSLFLVLPFLLGNTGVAGFAGGFVASLLPLAAVLLAVRVIDRWEPEPRRLLVFAFVWGAAVSIA